MFGVFTGTLAFPDASDTGSPLDVIAVRGGRAGGVATFKLLGAGTADPPPATGGLVFIGGNAASKLRGAYTGCCVEVSST